MMKSKHHISSMKNQKLNIKKIQNKKIHQSSNELIKSISNKPIPETKIKKIIIRKNIYIKV